MAVPAQSKIAARSGPRALDDEPSEDEPGDDKTGGEEACAVPMLATEAAVMTADVYHSQRDLRSHRRYVHTNQMSAHATLTIDIKNATRGAP